jgi:predicted amidohydrolase
MKLTLSLIQMAVTPSVPEENLRKAEGWIAEAVRKGSQLVCFPEMWTTGFQWEKNASMAAEHEKVIERIAGLARQHRIWINGSMLALDDNRRVSNTSILFSPQGERSAVYRKTHLFSLMHEERHMAPGRSLTMADAPWGRTGLAICYDLRFPELFRTYALKGARVVLSPAAFPHPRLEHWKILVRARAIENQVFMVAVNRVGSEDLGDGNLVSYFGHSAIIDPWGQTVVEAGDTEEELLTATIDLDQVDEIRARMTVLKDRRPDLYELD